MSTVLLDENIDGFAGYLSRHLFSSAWNDISSSLGVRLVTFDEVGLSKKTPDDQIWQVCQDQRYYLLTDNRNDNKPNSLEAVIRTRNLPTSLPVFTISDTPRLRIDREYFEALVARLLEYLMDGENILGTGRLYLP